MEKKSLKSKSCLIMLLLLALVWISLFYYLIQTRFEFFEYTCGIHDFAWGVTSCVLLTTRYPEYDGSPYELHIGASIYDEINVTSVIASNISVKVENDPKSIWESNHDYFLSSDFTKMRTKMPKGKVDVLYFKEKIAMLELPHKPLTVRATLMIHSNKGVIEEKVEYKLEPHYRLEEGNIFWDCIAGV